jgi:hypothetical protein
MMEIECEGRDDEDSRDIYEVKCQAGETRMGRRELEIEGAMQVGQKIQKNKKGTVSRTEQGRSDGEISRNRGSGSRW